MTSALKSWFARFFSYQTRSIDEAALWLFQHGHADDALWLLEMMNGSEEENQTTRTATNVGRAPASAIRNLG